MSTKKLTDVWPNAAMIGRMHRETGIPKCALGKIFRAESGGGRSVNVHRLGIEYGRPAP